MSFLCVLIALDVVLVTYYVLINKYRNQRSEAEDEDVTDVKAYSGLTDKQNINFRYVY